MQDIEAGHESWDKKRIFAGLLAIVLLIGIAYSVKTFVLGKNANVPLQKFIGNQSKGNVEGVQTKSEENNVAKPQPTSVSIPSVNNLQVEAQKKLENVKQEISSLSIADLASSSPQVRKIIEDVQNLEQAPRNQAKEACYNICKGL